jgi:hypothetical protein
VDLKVKLEKTYNMHRSHILNTVHSEKMPNQFVANYAQFATDNNDDDFIQQL